MTLHLYHEDAIFLVLRPSAQYLEVSIRTPDSSPSFLLLQPVWLQPRAHPPIQMDPFMQWEKNRASGDVETPQDV